VGQKQQAANNEQISNGWRGGKGLDKGGRWHGDHETGKSPFAMMRLLRTRRILKSGRLRVSFGMCSGDVTVS
jgi:hypothetical protein